MIIVYVIDKSLFLIFILWSIIMFVKSLKILHNKHRALKPKRNIVLKNIVIKLINDFESSFD